MCCDGTLFNCVTLVADDLPKLERYSQLKLKVRREQQSFDEPCPLHCAEGCSAYADRPDTCSRYVCAALRAVQRKELSEGQALLLIEEAKKLVESLKASSAFEAGMPLAVSTWEAPPAELSEAARAAWVRLAAHLNKHFLGMSSAAMATPRLSPTGPQPPAVVAV